MSFSIAEQALCICWVPSHTSHLKLNKIVGLYNTNLTSLWSHRRSAEGLLVMAARETGVQSKADDSLAGGAELTLQTYYGVLPPTFHMEFRHKRVLICWLIKPHQETCLRKILNYSLVWYLKLSTCIFNQYHSSVMHTFLMIIRLWFIYFTWADIHCLIEN